MRNLTATILDDKINLEKYADAINAGRTDDISFYVRGNRVSVSYRYTHKQLTEEQQRQELEWFLKGRIFDLK